MKRVPPSCPEPSDGARYWRSLEDLADTPEFRAWVEREFPAGASEFTDPVSRRHFVRIMSASFMLAGLGLSGCRRPVEKIVPFSKMPEHYVHGVPEYYATAMPVRGTAIPLLVKSSDGRPTKIEGNALHPDSNGATDVFAQASILDLYDPDRAMRCTRRGGPVTREEAIDFLRQLATAFGSAYRELGAAAGDKQGGRGLCFLLRRSSSPTRARLVARLRERLPQAKWFVHEPVDFDIHRQAATLAFGRPSAPCSQLEAAKVLVSLEADFIGTEADAWRDIRGFARGRRLEKPPYAMSRLYAVESLFTLTGANADQRLRVSSGQIVKVAAQLAARVLSEARVAGQGPSDLQAALARLGGDLPPTVVDPRWTRECATDLLAHRGEGLVLVGHRQPLAVHLLAHAMNVALGNVGRTVWLRESTEPQEGSLADLAAALRADAVDTLVILGGNPVYDAPADLRWAEAQRRAKTVVRLGYYEDETFAVSDWHLPLAHYLESWGDARTPDGTLVPVQPLIEPLFGGLTELEVLARLGGLEPTRPHELVRETFRGLAGEGEDRWKKFLHDGFLEGSAATPLAASLNWPGVANAVAAVRSAGLPTRAALEVVFHRDAKVDDGRYTNNGWLQELPDPVTKMTWENVVLMSRKTADDLGLTIRDSNHNAFEAPRVKVRLDGREVTGPVWIQPGMADYVVGLSLGYGRPAAGRVGKGSGYNAYQVRSSAAVDIAAGAQVIATGQWHPLATTQNHWAMEGRPVVREANLEQYAARPDFAKAMSLPEPPGPKDAAGRPAPLYPNPLDVPDASGQTPRQRATHAWGMSIDLNACVGCSACVVACQSENNIPIVGKDLVARNREMHWLRLDRYYAGGVTEPQMVTQPMLCQHCESAPCESVCPVNATAHDGEGLNMMAYNRCVGTRYCSNNCPYKVRRFNYLDYHRRPLDQLVGPFYPSPLVHATDGEWDVVRWFKNPDQGSRPSDEWELLKLAKNPDVTVRMRGVMEKCTFCVQRIEQAKIAQKVKAGASGDIEVRDGALRTACQQACPAEAIVFGNLKDPQSRVSQLKQQPRDYTVLEFLQTKPRATYLARIRNPNPAMPDYQEKPLSFLEWEKHGNELEAPGGNEAGHEATPSGAGKEGGR